MKFQFTTTVEAETYGQAVEVMNERIHYDEDYGFPYEIDWEDIPSNEAAEVLHEMQMEFEMDERRTELLD